MAEYKDPVSHDHRGNEKDASIKSDQTASQSKKEVPSLMTLEQIMEFTGEFEHLNELVVLYLKKNGGFSNNAEYFSCVQPLLDRLESEIRRQCWTNQSHDQITRIVKDWIDREISTFK